MLCNFRYTVARLNEVLDRLSKGKASYSKEDIAVYSEMHAVWNKWSKEKVDPKIRRVMKDLYPLLQELDCTHNLSPAFFCVFVSRLCVFHSDTILTQTEAGGSGAGGSGGEDAGGEDAGGDDDEVEGDDEGDDDEVEGDDEGDDDEVEGDEVEEIEGDEGDEGTEDVQVVQVQPLQREKPKRAADLAATTLGTGAINGGVVPIYIYIYESMML